MNLSPFLYELSTRIGLPQVLLLAAHYGGTPLYIPQRLGADHKLAGLLGLEAAQTLAAHYAGQTLYVALNSTGDHVRQGKKRQQRIRELKEQGWSHTRIARELRTTDRTVRKVLGKESNDKQGGLF